MDIVLQQAGCPGAAPRPAGAAAPAAHPGSARGTVVIVIAEPSLRRCIRRLIVPASIAWAGTTAAADPGAASPPDGPAVLPLASCVAGSPPLSVPAVDRRAVLDADDNALFHDAVHARFPVLDRFADEAGPVLLWGRADGEWLFVSLRAGAAQRPCFTATFMGRSFGFTPTLIRKYFPGAARI